MFSRSWKSLLLAKVLILVGCVLLFFGWTYGDAAKREARTVGTITRVDCGRSCTYVYIFKANDVRIQGDSSTCHTALTHEGCKVGAPVLVYYDPQHLSETMLEEFGAASRERYFIGTWMVASGLALIGVYFILKKGVKDPEKPDEPDESGRNGEPDVLHVVPGE